MSLSWPKKKRCRMGNWGWKQNVPVEEEPTIGNFTHSQPAPNDKDEQEPEGTFAKKNGRADDPGTGLSDRSREIERSLGYR